LDVAHCRRHRGRIPRLHGRPQVRRTDLGCIERGLECPLDHRADVVGCGIERILSLGSGCFEAVDGLERRRILRRSRLRHERGVEGEQLIQIGLDVDRVAQQGACRRLDAAARGEADDQQRHDDECEMSTTLHRDEG
jgi:hypothetical protein